MEKELVPLLIQKIPSKVNENTVLKSTYSSCEDSNSQTPAALQDSHSLRTQRTTSNNACNIKDIF